MGGLLERRRNWNEPGIADLNTLAVECIADPGAPLLPAHPDCRTKPSTMTAN